MHCTSAGLALPSFDDKAAIIDVMKFLDSDGRSQNLNPMLNYNGRQVSDKDHWLVMNIGIFYSPRQCTCRKLSSGNVQA